MERSASTPLSSPEAMGTPITGMVVQLARTPGRCAAIPAAAMITSIPRSRALLPYSRALSGVRCADITETSYSMPNCSRTSSAGFIESASDLLPITTPTNGIIKPPPRYPSCNDSSQTLYEIHCDTLYFSPPQQFYRWRPRLAPALQP